MLQEEVGHLSSNQTQLAGKPSPAVLPFDGLECTRLLKQIPVMMDYTPTKSSNYHHPVVPSDYLT